MSLNLATTQDFQQIVLTQTPLIDVRAPIEFGKGAFPGAMNLPLMQDIERQQVGLCYKQHGQQMAIELGHKLVNETVRIPRIQAWCEFKQQQPSALLYCFRGGLRSRISQQWIAEAGVEIVRLQGGYKAFRHYLMTQLNQLTSDLSHSIQPWVLAGRTGCGKTPLLNSVPYSIDLEGLAQHRGSTFGKHAWAQPSQIDFEHLLAYRVIQLQQQNYRHWLFEDEARNIGSVHLTPALFNAIKSGERILLDTPFEQRRVNILREYVTEAQVEYPSLQVWAEFMQSRFSRIAKRLGGVRYQQVSQLFAQAWLQQQQNNEIDGHLNWIDFLLREYYDPMYDYQLKHYPQAFAMQGDESEVRAFLQTQLNLSR